MPLARQEDILLSSVMLQDTIFPSLFDSYLSPGNQRCCGDDAASSPERSEDVADSEIPSCLLLVGSRERPRLANSRLTGG